ncbi:PTS system, beta-glucoside-specific IIB component [Lachnospiraceae bacterium KM106-2]|nr:PTS system, beta-glucoside-specific IIB component [Lachnospiraceae bacterium KM106-2]
MRKYEELVSNIIRCVGGKENVIDVKHCVTRLRFQLKEEDKAKDDVLKKMDGVITVMHSAGQYQVVIGNHVPEVFEEVALQLNLAKDDNQGIPEQKKSFKDKFIDLITSIFMPSIAILCACGMIKGLNTILEFAGIYTAESGIYALINAIGDCFFYFFPIVIGYNSAKKFRLNPYLGMMIGAALCYPSINGVDLNICGINMNVTYTSTVLPIILAVAIAAPLERWLNKVIPDVVKTFLTPMIVMLVATILGFMVIGPVANEASNLISSVLLSIYNVSPVVAGILFGGLWQVLVVFGVHMTFIVLAIMNIAQGVADPILSLQVFVAFAQAATVLAILIRTKDKKLKEICLPSFISALFGVTEPAIYGITLSRVKMFIVSCIGGAVSGGFAGFVGLKYQTMAGLGLFEIPALFPKSGVGAVIVQSCIAVVLAFVVSFVLAFIFFKDEENEVEVENEVIETVDRSEKHDVIYAPMSGRVIPLCEVSDDAFAQEALGKGVGIIPEEGKVYAPFDGSVVSLFPTNHAIGIASKNGCEVLIHVGMDTVQLEGKYFTAHINQGDQVKKGQLLVEFDLEKIKEAGYSLETPVIITNWDDYKDIINENKETVKAEDKLIAALR